MVFSGVCVARSLVFCVMLCRVLFVPLSTFNLAIIMSVILGFTASGYPFNIFKHFLSKTKKGSPDVSFIINMNHVTVVPGHLLCSSIKDHTLSVR